MQPIPKMKEVIEAIGKRLGIDFSIVGSGIRLDMPGYDCLYIERVDRYRIGIAHYYETDAHSIPEPYVVIFTKYHQEIGWLPIEITQSMTGRLCYVQMTEDNKGIYRYDEEGQAGLAEFTEEWAQNILDQGWIDNGVPRLAEGHSQQNAEQAIPDQHIWPEPTVDVPDMETIHEWLFADENCEATDGCPIEPDGICPHGHPSWLLRLGLM